MKKLAEIGEAAHLLNGEQDLAPVDGLRCHVEAQQPDTRYAHEKVGPFQGAPQVAGCMGLPWLAHSASSVRIAPIMPGPK
ncbi:MAG: hypothetical protein ING30_08895 [Burkholderiales bacterium]|nr:hypothetical protein [Burkholderiales bacterium]